MNIESRRVHVRPAVARDVPRLIAIETAAFVTDRISARSFRRQIKSPTLGLIVADVDNVVHGYALIAFRRTAHHARLYSLAVDAGEGRGLGRRLMDASEDLATQRGYAAMRLEVNESNKRAIDIYERVGFKRIGRRDDYYEDGAAALLYEKSLTAV